MSPTMVLLIAEVRIGSAVLLFIANVTISLTFQQNKKEHIEPRTWQEEPFDSQLGQVLFYLVSLQLRALCFQTHPCPVMGVFMADGKVSLRLLYVFL